jgi:pimeloyl-ACP methyl ester carboxylesterase
MRRTLPLLLAFITLAFGVAAQCHEPDTRVVVFVQGLYTNLQDDGTQGNVLEEHRFDTLKAAFRAKGYEDADLLDFSYAGGTVNIGGVWKPRNYDCEDTDRSTEANIAPLEAMLRDYKEAHPDAHFALVGHSLGGYLSFIAGARDAARPEEERLDIDVVVTLDAPLRGVSADKKPILDAVPCDKTFQAGAELVAQRLDPNTGSVRAYQAIVMAQAGIRVATLGNVNDCLFNTNVCLGSGWEDDSGSQFLDGLAAQSLSYALVASPLQSHEAILADPQPVQDAATFVGAP